MIGAAGVAVWILRSRFSAVRPVTVKGAVLVRNTDVDKQVPIPGVRVSVAVGSAAWSAWSTAAGFFELNLGKKVMAGQPVILQFRQPQYMPLDRTVMAGDRVEIAELVPIAEFGPVEASPPRTTMVSNIKIRYTIKTATALNVGSVIKTFHVVNTGNVPCDGRFPCSPDGKWKASIGSANFEAPERNYFSNARVSCIAGPCPYTRIRTEGFSSGGTALRATVLNWSDTTTFLFEAEVFRSMVSNEVRLSYPVIFGQTLHFTVPAEAEGVCIEADLDRDSIVFPLGPQALLTWAACTASVTPNRIDAYQCELKPGYGFK